VASERSVMDFMAPPVWEKPVRERDPILANRVRAAGCGAGDGGLSPDAGNGGVPETVNLQLLSGTDLRRAANCAELREPRQTGDPLTGGMRRRIERGSGVSSHFARVARVCNPCPCGGFVTRSETRGFQITSCCKIAGWLINTERRV
jgi:hypothetical protein